MNFGRKHCFDHLPPSFSMPVPAPQAEVRFAASAACSLRVCNVTPHGKNPVSDREEGQEENERGLGQLRDFFKGESAANSPWPERLQQIQQMFLRAKPQAASQRAAACFVSACSPLFTHVIWGRGTLHQYLLPAPNHRPIFIHHLPLPASS